MIARALAVGVIVGVVYTLSPLLVVALGGFALLLRWARQTADATERRWLVGLLVAAMGARLLVIAALFLSTDHTTVPFGWLFGDEEYFIRRSTWLANLALGIPVSLADVKYAFDDSIQTSFVWMLTAVNVVFGPSPYGLRMLSAVVYLGGAFALYRVARPSYGRPAALIGLTLLLFLPSLFAWSISVLKEPLFFVLMAGVVAVTVAVRRPEGLFRATAVAAIVLFAVVAETVRDGGAAVAGLGTAAGVALWLGASRPRVALAAAIVAAAILPATLSSGRVQDRLAEGITEAARRHWDHVNAPGRSYTIFEPAFYREAPEPARFTTADAVRLGVGGLAAYVTVPAPWEMRSRSELAYLPEQIVWYVLVALLPIGVVEGFRRDRFLSSVLLAHLLLSVALVALTAGNVGTMVRHRALAMPYLVWFSGLGLSLTLAWLAGIGSSRAPVVPREAGA